jgi:hypothetical protein
MREFVAGRSHVIHKTATKHVARLSTDHLRTGVQLPPPPPYCFLVKTPIFDFAKTNTSGSLFLKLINRLEYSSTYGFKVL